MVTLFYSRDFLFSIYTKYFTLSSHIKMHIVNFKLCAFLKIKFIKERVLFRCFPSILIEIGFSSNNSFS
ncbi:hypothetical protein EXW74_01395 [Streptococcus parasuis]|uniref:Uncharacterized protein n=1 Tax=Streptococcus parasuis TaxID=1501662 RepID=A0A4V2HCE6_9STRE|nr:hypothetical protein EXW74_01395 [Streptococcus parasuis]